MIYEVWRIDHENDEEKMIGLFMDFEEAKQYLREQKTLGTEVYEIREFS